jgi:glycosyltransferase involved in cell wall biosynthesis
MKNIESINHVNVAPPQEQTGGLRLKGISKAFSIDMPFISIITVVFNAGSQIENTIKSVINQGYLNIEFIIIDGGSADNTIQILKKYEDYIDYWVSEKDAGIYDAMNKGACSAKGEWICFMNAGDTFYSTSTVESIFNKNVPKCDVIFGNTIFTYDDFSKYGNSKNLNQFWKGMPFVHQSAFVNVDIQKKYPFRTDLKIAADFDFFYKRYKEGKAFSFCDRYVAVATHGGVSDRSRILSVLERWQVLYSCGINFHQSIYFALLVCIESVKMFIKFILPKYLIRLIQKR